MPALVYPVNPMKTLRYQRAAACLALAAAILPTTACSSAGMASDGGTEDAGSPGTEGGGPSFATTVYPILANCTACHATGASAAGGLDLSGSAAATFAVLVNMIPTGGLCAPTALPAGEKLVVPSDSTHSLLYNKVASAEPQGPQVACGSSMPLGSALAQAQVTTIKNWIDQGANP
jgi:hypothetical protein